jgi:hypothetical protein
MRKLAWMRFPIVLATTMFVAACPMGHSETVAKIVCPVAKQYSQETLNKALSEYNQAQNIPTLKGMIGDYKVLRDKVRACKVPNAA